MRNPGVFAVASAAAACGMFAAAPARAGVSAYVVHGIPGEDLGADPALPVDVSVNGDCMLPGFEFGQIVGPLPLMPGTYDFAISLANPDDPCGNDPVITAAGVPLDDGLNYSIVAHLDAMGNPTAGVFINDLDTRKRKAVVNVFHTAAAPEVDVRFRRSNYHWWNKGLRGVSNGEAGSVELRRGSWDVGIAPAGSHELVFGPVSLDLAADTAYLAFAVGSLGNGTFTVLLSTAENAVVEEAKAYVVHGIPGDDLGLDPALPVDVSVNGACALPGFVFGDVAGPLSLPAGAYDLAISLADELNPCSNDPVIEANGVMLEPGVNYSIVAHLDEAGAPTAGVFVNHLVERGPFAKVNVFHTAAAPAVDVEFARSHPWWWPARGLQNVSNGDQGSLYLLRGHWEASIFPAGAHEAVFGPAPLDLDRGTTYLVYAVGSLNNETFTLVVETIPPYAHGHADDNDDDDDDDDDDD